MPATEFNSTAPEDAALLRTLIDDLLDEQQRLTAVERFAKRHASDGLPTHSRYYRDLIPRTKPGEGQQYAFAVDLDVCTGCKGCVSACHSLNGLDEEELWRNVGLLHSATSAYQQTVTTACHHCVDPACMNGCPVLAYDKDPETGIVRHLDDQCIGCQYCVLKCPYEVPKYSKSRGIVRKCDMCSARLAHGEAPACVQACPNGAITIALVDQEALRASTTESDELLPGTVSSTYTLPTTAYRTRKPIPPDTTAGDSNEFRLQDPHWPLILMLVATQMGVGLFATVALLPGLAAIHISALMAGGTGLLHLGLAASTLHLGRPLGAWRAFLGLRRSWMSREIVAFGALAALATGTAVVASLSFARLAFLVQLSASLPAALEAGLIASTAVVGLAAIYCSAMIYIDTHRPSWAARHTIPKFFGTTMLLGAAGAASLMAWLEVYQPSGKGSLIAALGMLALFSRTALFGRDVAWFLEAFRSPASSDHMVARALWDQRREVLGIHCGLFIAATVSAIVALSTTGVLAAASATVSLALTFALQISERYFYFVASAPFKMPGAVLRHSGSHA